jgi:hypothetical protein
MAEPASKKELRVGDVRIICLLCLRAPAGIRRAEVGPGWQGEGAHAGASALDSAPILLP